MLFIDDVQWLDPATIELIERLTSEAEARNLLLICAYRDDEVGPEHPFARTREVMRTGSRRLEEMRLGPLTLDDMARLLADTLRSDPVSVRPLADIVIDKTEGNPFFVLQFLATMEEEELFVFDTDFGSWRWDVQLVRSKRITDNVAELVAAKLVRLPRMTLETVKLLACIGSGATLATLRVAAGRTPSQIVATLWEAVQARFVLRVDNAFIFAHDRVQEAAYLLIPEADRPIMHLRIGRALISKMTPGMLRDRMFEVMDQFGRGLEHINSPEECQKVAKLYLDVGSRAKTSAAYPSAMKYFRTGLSLLKSEDWKGQYRLRFSLELQHAECAFLIGDHIAAEKHLRDLAAVAPYNPGIDMI